MEKRFPGVVGGTPSTSSALTIVMRPTRDAVANSAAESLAKALPARIWAPVIVMHLTKKLSGAVTSIGPSFFIRGKRISLRYVHNIPYGISVECSPLGSHIATLRNNRLAKARQRLNQPGPSHFKDLAMQQVTPTMPSARGFHHPIPAGPYRTPIRSSRSVERLDTTLPSQTQSRAIMTGQAGACLVQSRLLSWGIPAHTAMEGLPYDLICAVPGLDMLRIQVKTQTKPKGKTCAFRLKRGFYRSQKGIFRYETKDFDIAALVCLSMKQVFFVVAPVDSVSIPTHKLRILDIDQQTFELAIQHVAYRRQMEELAWLASLPAEAPAPAMPATQPELAMAEERRSGKMSGPAAPAPFFGA